MALPNITPNFICTKKSAERRIVEQRNREYNIREKWQNNAQYFNKNNSNIDQMKSWESNACFQNSMNAWQNMNSKEKKDLELSNRRNKLFQILNKETQMFMIEISKLKESSGISVHNLIEKQKQLTLNDNQQFVNKEVKNSNYSNNNISNNIHNINLNTQLNKNNVSRNFKNNDNRSGNSENNNFTETEYQNYNSSKFKPYNDHSNNYSSNNNNNNNNQNNSNHYNNNLREDKFLQTPNMNNFHKQQESEINNSGISKNFKIENNNLHGNNLLNNYQIRDTQRQENDLEHELDERNFPPRNNKNNLTNDYKMTEQNKSNVMKDIMAQLQFKEMEAEKLKAREQMLSEVSMFLFNLMEERNRVYDQRSRVEFGKVLLRQHVAALISRSNLIKNELEEDRIFIDKLQDNENILSQMENASDEEYNRNLSELMLIKEVIEDQIDIEISRQTELETLFKEEAAKIWQLRDTEWAKERMARQQILQQLLLARQNYVRKELERVQIEMQECLDSRMNLLEKLEKIN